MERVKGIEPSSQAWEAHVLPLNHTRFECPGCSSDFLVAQLTCLNAASRRSKPHHFLELPDPLLDGRTRHSGRARQPKTLTAKGSHHAAINHAPLEVRLNRAFAARQITNETADKRVARASRVNHLAQGKRRRHEQAAGRGEYRAMLALFHDDVFRPQPMYFFGGP